MFKKLLRRIIRLLLILGLLSVLGLFLNRIIFLLYANPRMFTVEEVPFERVAIVFGAEVKRDGTPSTALRDRVETAAALYQAGKVEKLLMSGDNRFVDYNEPEAMRQYALRLGVPDADIVLDYAGRRTYDTCYRAKQIFEVDSAILVTQGFHLPRALFLCNSFGLKAVGVEANNYYYLKRLRLVWGIREMLATTQALWDVYVAHPVPVLGEPQPIFSMTNKSQEKI